MGLYEGSTVVIDPRKLANFMRSSDGPVLRYMIARGETVKTEARRLVGVDTGNLRDHILKRVIEQGGMPVVIVGVENVPYAYWHHQGTEPHVIEARRAPLLVFYWKKVGRVVAFPRVQHPGTKPNPFLVRALEALR